jgi:hypothetical protein
VQQTAPTINKDLNIGGRPASSPPKTPNMPSEESQALSLHFSNHVRVAGEPLHGTVELDMTQAQADNIEQVRVKLRGSIQTSLPSSTSCVTYSHLCLIQTYHPEQWAEQRHLTRNDPAHSGRCHPVDPRLRLSAAGNAHSDLSLQFLASTRPPAIISRKAHLQRRYHILLR